MMSIIPSPNIQMEEQRLAALYSYDVLGEGLNNELDNLVKLAAQISGVKMAYITFVDRDTVVLKATYGLNVQELVSERAGSISNHGMYQQVYIVANIAKNPAITDAYLNNNEQHIVFYGSLSLIDNNGFSLGCLCVADDS